MLCRCCENSFEIGPILHFADMPGMAQNFPSSDDLSEDKGTSMDVFQCPFCGTIQLAGEPVSYYKDVIRAAAVSDEMRDFRLQYFGQFAKKYGLTGKKILEIGAGHGEFLEMMNSSGVDGYGIEHSEKAVSECRKKGLKVSCGYIESEDQEIENAPFDGFFIMNFLEHIPSPNVFLKGIYNNLSEGAVGLIEVPNTDIIIKKAMFSEFISDHLLYFTKDTLCRLLQSNGFEVLECNTVWHEYCLAAVLRKRKNTDIAPLLSSMKKISEELNEYIDSVRETGRKVLIWGAGHQALAVISLCGIAEKIDAVVDSAVFKQGKYTPASHIKIVSPEILLSDADIGAVIVMAASYSDEVAGIISRDYPGIKAAILRDWGLQLI